jgi:dolichyl-phosphate-mannose-protein mannosyltransferase
VAVTSPSRPEIRVGTPRRTVPVEIPVLAALALLTRLSGITGPRAIVFDEVYFREYALRYQSGSYYFDLHPPLGKLLLGAWAVVSGTHVAPESPDPAVALRFLPALAGCGLVLVVYALLRELGGGRKVATFAAALVVLDNALLVESRLILIDSMLLLFGVGALTVLLAARRATGRRRILLLAGAAALGGAAVATKWTGLAMLGVVGLLWGVAALRERYPWRRILTEGAVLVAVPALLYAAVFAVHFALLPRSGPGDAYMSPAFQSTLVGNPAYDPAASMPFPAELVELNQAIPAYEHSLDASAHPYGSSWLSWPLMQRGVYYWNGPGADPGTQRYLYLLGNPAIWWGLLAGVAVVAVAWIRRPDRFAGLAGPVAVLGVAWAANYLPFATIVRPMFLYHYFFALICCMAAVSLGLGRLAGWDAEPDTWRFPSRVSLGVYAGLLGLVVLGFAWFAPLSYALPLSDAELAGRMWLSTWR